MTDAARHFQFVGEPVLCEPYGNGHINRTYLVRTDRGVDYILQRVNEKVFRDVAALMENVAAVTRFLAAGEPDPRRVLTLIPTTEGVDYHLDETGGFWRAYLFITDSVCLERAGTPRDFAMSGVAFGRFQKQLALFPAATLHETIPRFHDTPNRCAQLMRAVADDPLERLREVKPEVDFILAREERAGKLMDMRRSGELPVRVTHNDTKLNNVLLDKHTREPLCVIDLDTVMPGLAAFDFGDSVRFGASTAAEDETDLGKVSMSLELFEHFAKGFLSECGKSLTAAEISALPLGAWTMTLECGVRFLSDYLSGDVYFRVHRERHNLDRCRTQLKLVADMEAKWVEMERTIQRMTKDG